MPTFVNGQVYGGDVKVGIRNNRLYINGVLQDGEPLQGVVEVRVTEGSLVSLETDASVTCGDVTGDVDAGGSVTSKTVGGSVDAGGTVKCGDIRGNVNAGGSITCGKVDGNVNAGGSVRMGG